MNEMSTLVLQFEAERLAEDARLKSAEHVRISPWNPRTTMQRDMDRCEKRVTDLMCWSAAWWRRNEYRVIWNNDAVGYQVPSFEVELLRTKRR